MRGSDRLGDVTNRPFNQRRLVLVDQRDDVLAGDVAVVDDRPKPVVSKSKEIFAILPEGIVDRIVRACSRFGNDRSST
jgi:hypothetical protein